MNASCLRSSPTAQWWREAGANGRAAGLAAHLEERADYDGAAVVWGLGHKAAIAQACGEAGLNPVPAPPLAGASLDLSSVGLWLSERRSAVTMVE